MLLVAPALNTRLRHYLSDVDPAVAAARERLELALTASGTRSSRPRARSATPTRTAIADALARFPATEIIVSTLRPASRTGSNAT